MDVLETRTLLSATAVLNGTALLLNGDRAANQISVDPSADGLSYVVRLDAQILNFPVGAVTSLTIVGNNGDDRLVNNTALNSVVNGGNGDDYIQGGLGNDLLDGDNGDDVVDNFLDGAGTNTLIGGNGDDNLTGGRATDFLFGGNGKDQHYDILGSNYHDGGNGVDRLFTAVGNTVVDGPARDLVITFFKNRGAPVALEDGVLYYLPDLLGTDTNTVLLNQVGANLVLTVNGVDYTFLASMWLADRYAPTPLHG